ncbi:MAG: glycosyltransferase family 39 protein [Planctomycetaceae bacterium]|jgi:4-amino-4-deoxy-L-arabinose transferase-like glycosyltransferase|nr:glycosyltransferase family 39 protein [Planctomycetaceae bacterium]
MTKYFPAILFFIFSLLLLGNIFLNSPVQSEDAHLASGISHHQFWKFDLYKVNPPLVRSFASFPVYCLGNYQSDWKHNSSYPLLRREHQVGVDFVSANKQQSRTQIQVARIACMIFILIGGFCCYRLAGSVHEKSSGILALFLLFFSPYILGHGATIMPDVPSAAFAIASVYFFWKWLKRPEMLEAFIAGIILGFAELTKFTLLIFYPMFVVMWLLYRLPEIKTLTKNHWFQQVKQMAMMFATSILIINMGYLFEGTGKLLGSYRFQTMLFTGYKTLADVPTGGGNRFEKTQLAYLPILLPSNFIQGIDTQRLDFERGLPSYLRGEWSEHGWHYYYLYALLIKMPLGTIGLFLLAIFCTFFQKGYNIAWRDEMVVILPGIVLLAFVSSQTGFSVHSRYVIPALPFFFLWISKVGKAFPMKRPMVVTIASVLLAWSVLSSLSIYPYSLSYFNELAAILPTPEDKNYPKLLPEISKTAWQKTKSILSAGPRNGARHLLDSNIDWGQDLFYLEKWYQKHPEAKDMKVAYWGSYPLELTTIPSKEMPPANKPQPGWYALSVNYIDSREKQYRYFLNFEPVATAGYSLYIYHITLEDANRVRREMGLPEIEATTIK